jgi:hypothetical protein
MKPSIEEHERKGTIVHCIRILRIHLDSATLDLAKVERVDEF